MTLWKRIKKAFNNYLEQLSAENKKMFGDGRPDCCKLNEQTKNQKRST